MLWFCCCVGIFPALNLFNFTDHLHCLPWIISIVYSILGVQNVPFILVTETTSTKLICFGENIKRNIHSINWFVYAVSISISLFQISTLRSESSFKDIMLPWLLVCPYFELVIEQDTMRKPLLIPSILE